MTDPISDAILGAHGGSAPDAAQAIPNPADELAAFKNMSLDQIISTIATDLAHFAISLAAAILVFYVGKFIINRLYGLTDRILHRRNVEASLATFVLSFVRIVLYFILIITCIGIIGIETTSFLALFASAGVAVGMALSGTLQNFAGGVLILALKPFKVGDYIEAQGFAGTVKKIEMFNTIITTPDYKTIIIPNGGLSTGSINNWSREAQRRVSWNISLAYGDDVARAREVILEMLNSDPRVVTTHESSGTESVIPGILPQGDRSATVFLDQLADSAIVIQARAWTRTSDYWGLYYDMNERFYTELPKLGFHFPFPQLDVHLNRVES